MATLVENAEQLVGELTGMLREAHRVLAKARVTENAKNLDIVDGRFLVEKGLSPKDFVGFGPATNDDPDGRFITVKGHAIFIPHGKDVGDALKEHFDKFKGKGKGDKHVPDDGGHGEAGSKHGAGHPHGHDGGEHGEHDGHDPLEHAGHQAHAAQDLATVHEAFGGGHAAHAAIHDAHAAGEAAHAAGEAGHGATGLDAAAIGARHLYGPALKATSALMSKVPGLRTVGAAVKAVHEKATALNQRITEGLISRYGKATAGAILGVGSAMSHTVGHGVGLHGPAASALPGPHLIGAVPFIAAAEVGKRLGLVGKDSKLEKGLGVVGAWTHALMNSAGKAAGAVTGKVAGTGLRGAHLAGRLTGKVIRGAKRLTGNQLTNIAISGYVLVDADSLDVWNVREQRWDAIDDLIGGLDLTDNELTEVLELVCNAEEDADAAP